MNARGSAVIGALTSLFDAVLNACAALASLLVAGQIALISANVLLRNLGHPGFVWTEEVSEYALYAVACLTAPWLLRQGGHVRVDLLATMLPPRGRRALDIVADALGLAVSAALALHGFDAAGEAARSGSLTFKNLIFPDWWLVVVLPCSLTLIAFEFCSRLATNLSGVLVPAAAPAPRGAPVEG